LVYSHKPQRSGRSIQANTNNPPQDPPPPPPPPVPEPCVEEKPIITIPEKKISKPQITKQTAKVSIFRQIIYTLMFWRRK